MPEEVVGGLGGRISQRPGKPRDTGIHRPTRHLQDHLVPFPPAARTAQLLRGEEQQPPHEQGRPYPHGRGRIDLPGRNRKHDRRGVGPDQGCRIASASGGACRLCPQQGSPSAPGFVLRNGQSPELPHRHHGQPPLAPVRSGKHPQSLRPPFGLYRLVQPGNAPLAKRLSLLVRPGGNPRTGQARKPFRGSQYGGRPDTQALPCSAAGRSV